MLKDYKRLQVHKYDKGDYCAADLLMDVDKAVELANLTYKQRQAIYLHYIEDMTQEKAAEEMGITQQALWHHVQGALKRILKVFKAWNYVEVIVSLEKEVH